MSENSPTAAADASASPAKQTPAASRAAATTSTASTTVSSFTHLDSILKELPELKQKRVNLHLGDLSGVNRTTLSCVNRIVAPLDQVDTLNDLSHQLHHIESHARDLQIFREFKINMPQMQWAEDHQSLDITLDVECVEMDATTPLFGATLRQNPFRDLELQPHIAMRNLLGQSETFSAKISGNARKAWATGLQIDWPLLNYQGLQHLSLYGAYGKEHSSFVDPQKSNHYLHLQSNARLTGNHSLQWNLKKRLSQKYNILNSLSYKYFWDNTIRNQVTSLREKGVYSDLQCTMATFNSNPSFVKTQFSTNFYVPLLTAAVASLHFNVSGMQPFNTNYSSTDFTNLNDRIHPMDRLYTNVRGYNVVGDNKKETTSASTDSPTVKANPTGGNFAINVEGRLAAPLKFLGVLYNMTHVHGQGFIQAGNVIPLDFEKGDIERAQSNFVQSAKASYGVGMFVLMQNLRFELNYCQQLRLNKKAAEDASNFSRLQLYISTEF